MVLVVALSKLSTYELSHTIVVRSFGGLVLLLTPPAPRFTVGPDVKNPPKIRFIKIVKLTDHTYACISLTIFEYKNHSPETEIDVNLLKCAWKNS